MMFSAAQREILWNDGDCDLCIEHIPLKLGQGQSWGSSIVRYLLHCEAAKIVSLEGSCIHIVSCDQSFPFSIPFSAEKPPFLSLEKCQVQQILCDVAEQAESIAKLLLAPSCNEVADTY
eukprot:scaffold19320_cov242-Skeletonema_marinoi.AAC.4